MHKRINWWYFSNYSQRIGSDTSCKLSTKETICMKCQSYFQGNKKNISKCRLLKFLPSIQNVKNLKLTVENEPSPMTFPKIKSVGVFLGGCLPPWLDSRETVFSWLELPEFLFSCISFELILLFVCNKNTQFTTSEKCLYYTCGVGKN